jgi:peptide deformylase
MPRAAPVTMATRDSVIENPPGSVSVLDAYQVGVRPTLPDVAGTARKITVVGDPVLAVTCRPVTRFDQSLAELIADMVASMKVANGVGLAAPQVGVDLAVFVFDCPDEFDVQRSGHVVNPVIELGTGEQQGEEGCLSVPGPYEELTRANSATVRGFDQHGAPIEVSGTGFLARCLQHETDHLSGKLYIDRLPRNRRRKVRREMEPFEWNAPIP